MGIRQDRKKGISSFAVNSSYYYNTNVLITPRVRKEISIHITLTTVSCLQCSVNEIYNMSSPVMLTRAGWCVVCVVDYLASSYTFAFHKVVWQHYSVEVGDFVIFWCKISSKYCTPCKIIEIDSVVDELFTIWKWGRFIESVVTVKSN